MSSTTDKISTYGSSYPEMPIKSEIFSMYDLGSYFRITINKSEYNVVKSDGICTNIFIKLDDDDDEVEIIADKRVVFKQNVDFNELGGLSVGTGYNQRYWSGSIEAFSIYKYKGDIDENADLNNYTTEKDLIFSLKKDLRSEESLFIINKTK